MAKGTSKGVTVPGTFTPPAGFFSVGFQKWQPEPGDVLHGIYRNSIQVKGRPKKGRGGSGSEEFLVHHVDGEDGARWTVSGAALDRHFATIEVGSEIYIHFKGEVKLPGGKRFKDFEVFAKKAKTDESGRRPRKSKG